MRSARTYSVDTPAARNATQLWLTLWEMAQLRSNDPVCAHHELQSGREHRYLHGAACHGCVLVAETSCEQQNDFLDRALVVRTVEAKGAEFFPEIDA